MMHATRKDNDTLRLNLLKPFARSPLFRSKVRQRSFLLFTSVFLILLMLVGCGRGPQTEDLEAVDYTPLIRDDWKVSTRGEQGLDPMLVTERLRDDSTARHLQRLGGPPIALDPVLPSSLSLTLDFQRKMRLEAQSLSSSQPELPRSARKLPLGRGSTTPRSQSNLCPRAA